MDFLLSSGNKSDSRYIFSAVCFEFTISLYLSHNLNHIIMPPVSHKRKTSFTDSLEPIPDSLAKRPRIEPNNEVGDSWTAVNNDMVELKAKLEEITKRYSELEKKARINSEAIHRAHERLQCSICKDTMRNPYTLDCGHSACLKCLKRHFISARELSRYTVYGDGTVSTDDDSDGEEESSEMIGQLYYNVLDPTISISRSQSQLGLPHRHRFLSVVHHKKECPICKTGIWRRPVIDYALRHVIDELHLTPLSPTSLMDRDLRWGRRRDVWRGIFPPDPYAENHRQEAQSRTRTQVQNQNQNQDQTPIPGRSRPVPSLPTLPFPFDPRHYTTSPQAERRRRRLHLASVIDRAATTAMGAGAGVDTNADVQRRRRLGRFGPVIGGSSSLYTIHSTAPSSLLLPQASSSRIEASNPPAEPEPGPELVLRLGPRLTRHESPPPQLDFLEGIDIFSDAEGAEIEREIEADLETLRASLTPPQLEHPHPLDLAASSSEPDTLHPQSTIREILQILRPRFASRLESVDLSPNHVEDEAEVRENERMCGGDAEGEEVEDVDFFLVHAMLHGENANAASGSGSSSGSDSLEEERYPVYVEELELLVEQDDGDGVWLGADLED